MKLFRPYVEELAYLFRLSLLFIPHFKNLLHIS